MAASALLDDAQRHVRHVDFLQRGTARKLVQAILLVKSKPALSDEETMACVSTFLAYFQTMQPNFWNVLRKTKRPMAYLIATIKAWAEESGLDPKAFTSPTSGTTTARH